MNPGGGDNMIQDTSSMGGMGGMGGFGGMGGMGGRPGSIFIPGGMGGGGGGPSSIFIPGGMGGGGFGGQGGYQNPWGGPGGSNYPPPSSGAPPSTGYPPSSSGQPASGTRKKMANPPPILTKEQLKDGEDECPVCYVKWFEAGEDGKIEYPIRLTCGHLYGQKCLEEWIQETNSCPMCKVEFPVVNASAHRMFSGGHVMIGRWR